MKSNVFNFKNQIILLACMFVLCSCDKIKEKATVTVPFDSFSIQLDDIVVGGGVKSAIVRLDGEEVELNSFNGSQVLTKNGLKDPPADLETYWSDIVSVEVGSTTSVTVIAIDDPGTVVKDFLMEATGISTKLSVANYNLGASYSHKNLETFATELLTKVIVKNSEVPITISGKTDVAEGKNLRVTITVRDGLLKIKAL